MDFIEFAHAFVLLLIHWHWDNRKIAQCKHYNDVIMTTIASQITSLTVVYSVVYTGADQRKHQSSASLAFVWGIHRDRGIPRTMGQLRGKCFHLMTSSCEGWSLKSIVKIQPYRNKTKTRFLIQYKCRNSHDQKDGLTAISFIMVMRIPLKYSWSGVQAVKANVIYRG